jgi:hypothetical protein
MRNYRIVIYNIAMNMPDLPSGNTTVCELEESPISVGNPSNGSWFSLQTMRLPEGSLVL